MKDKKDGYADFFARFARIDPNVPPPSYEDFMRGIAAIENDAVREDVLLGFRQVLRTQMEMREKALERSRRWKAIKRIIREFFQG